MHLLPGLTGDPYLVVGLAQMHGGRTLIVAVVHHVVLVAGMCHGAVISHADLPRGLGTR